MSGGFLHPYVYYQIKHPSAIDDGTEFPAGYGYTDNPPLVQKAIALRQKLGIDTWDAQKVSHTEMRMPNQAYYLGEHKRCDGKIPKIFPNSQFATWNMYQAVLQNQYQIEGVNLNVFELPTQRIRFD